jgi:VanZ family protein
VRNIIYLLPWGVLVYVFVAPHRRALTKIAAATLIGWIVSFSIELCQIFFTKHPSIFDILANSAGAGLGALLCAHGPLDVRRLATRCLARVERPGLLFATALSLGTVPLLIAVSNFPGLGFGIWNWHYTFQFGNEASWERPSHGVIYRAAVYDRALGPAEIAQRHQLSAPQEYLRDRASLGLIVFCTIGESRGGARGVTQCGLPLNLALLPTSHFRWLQGRNGIEVLKPGALKRERPAEELFNAIRGRKELSVELWMTRATFDRQRNGSVVSLAQDSLAPNLVVPAYADIDVRAPRQLSNASFIKPGARKGFLTSEKFHLVITYKGGVRKLFVNGRAYPYKNFDLRLADFIVSFGNNPVAQIAYSLVYFFPVSFLFSRVLSKRSTAYSATLVVPLAVALILLSLSEFFQAYLFGRSVDRVFMCYGVVVVIAGALSGIFLAKKMPAAQESLSSS